MLNIALLSIGFLGLVIAAVTPRSTLGGAVSLLSFAAYFFMNENDEWYTIIIFILGISLLIFEVFIPDFGIAGIIGVLLIFFGLYQTVGDLGQAIRDLSIAVLLSISLIIVLAKKGYSFDNFSKLVLKNDLTSERGFSSSIDHSSLLGQTGKTLTALRPTGKAVFEEITLDVLSQNERIEENVLVEVVKVEGSKIIVRRVIENE
ncbi:hydrolase [Desemzia sp. RIT804]|uniref:NfeD family protein n=1 Tax=Desemzia sp. RIT 804 TaxID=2810209 RepID=UPI00195279AD|nr:NfeD family protein [Desemzia sp. RIT 804]MBM6614456.1 hydrolase [Desemzia sp. RIT 804]